jgi:hypothetical protein
MYTLKLTFFDRAQTGHIRVVTAMIISCLKFENGLAVTFNNTLLMTAFYPLYTLKNNYD